MRDHARAMFWLAAAGAAVLAGISAGGGPVQAQDPNSAPNPYHVVEHWAKLPQGPKPSLPRNLRQRRSSRVHLRGFPLARQL